VTTGLELRRQGCAETEGNGIGCELVSHLRIALHFELGEQRRGQCLASFGSCVVPQAGQRAQVGHALLGCHALLLPWLAGHLLLGVEPGHRRLPRGDITGLGQSL
jgi:hypothetical protein